MKFFIILLVSLMMLLMITKYTSKSLLNTDREALYKRQSILSSSPSASASASGPVTVTATAIVPIITSPSVKTITPTLTKPVVIKHYSTLYETIVSTIPPVTPGGASTTVKVVQAIASPIVNYDGDYDGENGSSGSGNSLNVKELRGIWMSIAIVLLSALYILIA